MKLTRHYFISKGLSDLEAFEQDLERAGIVIQQCHVITGDDLSAAQHAHLHKVNSFMKVDVVRSTKIGAALGAGLALIGLLIVYLAGWHRGPAGWMPFAFLAVVILGFSTWQGGLWGIQTRNASFRRFEKAMDHRRHVFFIDIKPHHEATIKQVTARHAGVHFAGTDRGAPRWLVFSQHHVTRFFTHTFP